MLRPERCSWEHLGNSIECPNLSQDPPRLTICSFWKALPSKPVLRKTCKLFDQQTLVLQLWMHEEQMRGTEKHRAENIVNSQYVAIGGWVQRSPWMTTRAQQESRKFFTELAAACSVDRCAIMPSAPQQVCSISSLIALAPVLQETATCPLNNHTP